jgi:serine/threonine protein kinase
MEHLEGETLEEVLQRRGRLPAGEAVRLVYQAALGLQHLHEQDVVHRDLNPANLMLCGGTADTTAQATVKILDVGLGRALFDEGDLDGPIGNLTQPGALLGDGNYRAPEQTRNAHRADVRADLYSLGCVLYRCLTGQPPFPDSNIVRQMQRHATEPPRLLRDFDPQAPDALQQIVTTLLAKDPARRYPTPRDAAAALKQFLDRAPERVPRAVPVPAADPRMEEYLAWLAANDRPVPGPEPAPPPPPAATAPRMGKPVVARGVAPPPRRKPKPAAFPVGSACCGISTRKARPWRPSATPGRAGNRRPTARPIPPSWPARRGRSWRPTVTAATARTAPPKAGSATSSTTTASSRARSPRSSRRSWTPRSSTSG